MSAIMQGWLSKRAVSAVIYKSWKKRHITLTADTISWHADVALSARGSLPIDACTTAIPDELALHLSVKHGDRELLLQCSSASELDQWRAAVQGAIQSAELVSSDAVCAICLDDCTSGETIRTACCGNHFHRACLAEWLQASKHKTCPLCRADASYALRFVHACERGAGDGSRLAVFARRSGFVPRLGQRIKCFVALFGIMAIGMTAADPVTMCPAWTTCPGLTASFIAMLALYVTIRCDP